MWETRYGPLHRDGLAGIEERPELRHCDLVDGGIQSAWRARDCLHEKQSRSEEHTSELQSLMRISYAVFCLKNKIIMKIYSNIIVSTMTANDQYNSHRPHV